MDTGRAVEPERRLVDDPAYDPFEAECRELGSWFANSAQVAITDLGYPDAPQGRSVRTARPADHPSTIGAPRPSIRLMVGDRDSVRLETVRQFLRTAEGRCVSAVDLIRGDAQSLPGDAAKEG